MTMLPKVKAKLPKWCYEKNEGASLILGDDIDSLLGCSLWNHIHENEIQWFYDFKNKYIEEGAFIDEFDSIGIDMALEDGKCIDNHVTKQSVKDYYNVDSVNLNNYYSITRSRYTKKYAMSTFMLICSIFNIPLPKTDEGKKIFLAVDVSFKGHYSSAFKDTQNGWLKALGYEELIEFQDKHTSEDFYNTIVEYGLNEKIGLLGGRLVSKINLKEIQKHFDFPIELPSKKFEIFEKYTRNSRPIAKGKSFRKDENTVSFAMTGQNYISYTKRNPQGF